MPEQDYEAVLRRRRIWGVPPDAVEQMAMECERTQTEVRARLRELEVRLAHVTAQRDEATESVTALRERVAQLEREHAEVAGRPELVREEALRFVVDAWAEAQTIREQTRQEIERSEAAAREEVAAIRQALVAERERHEAEMHAARERHEAEIALLRERRQKAIAALESLAEGLLSQATRTTAPPQPDAAPEAAEPESTSPDAVHSQAMTVAPPAPSPESAEAAPTSTAAASDPSRPSGNGEDQLLAKALDDLEAILSGSREGNGAG